MIPKPLNGNVFLKIEKELFDTITTESGFELSLVPEYNFENNATVSGELSSLPNSYKGNLSVSDLVAFSYSVISHRSFPNTAEHFVPVSDGGEQLMVWMNSKGESIRKFGGHKGAISTIWTATYFDKKGLFQHGCQGTEHDVDRWLAQFKFGNAQGFTYKNLIELDGIKYWKCKDANVFAKKVGDEIQAVGDRVICQIIDIEIDKQQLKVRGIDIPGQSVQMRFYDRAVVISGGESIGVKKGDVISFQEKYCEKYNLWGKEYFLIKENRVEGIYG